MEVETFTFFSKFVDRNPTHGAFVEWCGENGRLPPTLIEFVSVIEPRNIMTTVKATTLKEFVAHEKRVRQDSKARRAGQSAPRALRSVKPKPTLIRR